MNALPELGFARPCFHPGRNTSVRRGERWHGVAAASVHVVAEQPPRTVALHTELRRFAELTDADLRDEHDPACRSPAGLLAVMQALYPGFAPDEVVTLVHFWLD